MTPGVMLAEIDTLRTDNHSIAEHLAVVTLQASKVQPLLPW